MVYNSTDMNLDSINKNHLKLIEIDVEEQLVCSIKKHPIGLVGIYIFGIIAILGILFGGIWLGATLSSNDLGVDVPFPLESIIIGVVAIVAILIAVITYIAGYIYMHNILIVTSDKIVQILYRNLVDRKVSQLSLGELQDITVDQKGLLARVFGYGTLVIETAGEQNNYNFTYAVQPYECAKMVVGAREMIVKKYGN